MSAKAIAAVAEARKVADYLDGIGEHKRANDVRRVCRSNDSYRGTLSQLHKDNMELRGIETPSVTLKVREPPARWCAFCEMAVSAIEAASCKSRNCSLREHS